MNIAKNQLTPRSPLSFEEIREVVSAERGSGYVNEAIGNEGRALKLRTPLWLNKHRDYPSGKRGVCYDELINQSVAG
jgi:hypothetical protein